MDEFWVKLIFGGGGGLAVALYGLWQYGTGRIVPGKAVEEALKRQADDFAQQLEELERSLAYEREQKRNLQEDNERWILRYTEAAHHVHRAKEVAQEAVNTAKEIASRSTP